MHNRIVLTTLMIFIGGCAASTGGGEGVEDPLEEEPRGGVEQKLLPPEDDGCDASDEYYYETTSYTSASSYLWHCVGYSGWNVWYECDTYEVCQVVKAWAHYGICVDGVLYGYKYLKSTTLGNCGNVSYASSGGLCPNPLYGGYCY